MTQWLLIGQQQYSENNGDYGYGDYPEQIDYIRMVVEADTIRKAQNAAKKAHPNLRFGGMFSPMLLKTDDKYANLYIKPADPRLGPNATIAHNTAMALLTR